MGVSRLAPGLSYFTPALGALYPERTDKHTKIQVVMTWHTGCCCTGMRLNTAILREITFQISSGNPYWGMLLGNEYLGQNDYLRRALVARFVARIGNTESCRLLARNLVQGAAARDLPDNLLQLVGARSTKAKSGEIRVNNVNRLSFRSSSKSYRRRPAPSRLSARPFSVRASVINDHKLG